MKILVLNGSLHREKSITYKVTDIFLKGVQEAAPADSITVLPVYDLDIRPCRADFACWFRTPGSCVIDDDAAGVYQKIREADRVIWSVPLYVFGFPAPVKMLLDRILPFVRPEIVEDDAGLTSHPGLGDAGAKHLLIMSGALPGEEDNFGSAVTEFKRTFGRDSICMTCAESSLLIYRKSEKILKLAEDYLELARRAGREYRATGRIHTDALTSLNSLMMPKEDYIRFTNGRL